MSSFTLKDLSIVARKDYSLTKGLWQYVRSEGYVIIMAQPSWHNLLSHSYIVKKSKITESRTYEDLYIVSYVTEWKDIRFNIDLTDKIIKTAMKLLKRSLKKNR